VQIADRIAAAKCQYATENGLLGVLGSLAECQPTRPLTPNIPVTNPFLPGLTTPPKPTALPTGTTFPQMGILIKEILPTLWECQSKLKQLPRLVHKQTVWQVAHSA